jgi:RNA polymerase sigma factor (sigma-70 family)
MTDDSELLRQYVHGKSEKAFAELVQRHVDLVYAAALRQTDGNGAVAEEVAQAVFTDLARKAAALVRHVTLVGWLNTATRFAVKKVRRTEARRREREFKAHSMEAALGSPASEDLVDWKKLQPVFDDVLSGLKERERAAILLRFFEKKPLAEVGETLTLSESAARSCIDRALEKMRSGFARRGITSTGAALGLVLANQLVGSAPAGLAVSLTGAALAGAAAVGGAGTAFVFMSTVKFGAAMSGLALLLAATAIYQSRQVSEVRETMLRETRELGRRLVEETRRAEAADRDNARLLVAIVNLSESKKTEQPITKEMVIARLKRANELTQAGNGAAALAEYLWCLDEGAPRFAKLESLRTYVIPNQIFWLGQSYPPALEALRIRRDRLESALRADPNNFDQARDVVDINRVLREPMRAVEELERYPKGDARRYALAALLRDDLLEARRYSAVLEGRGFRSMNTEFEVLLQYNLSGPPREVAPGEPSDVFHQHRPTLASAARDIEALAGAGDLDHARQLAKRVLDFDDSDDTRELLQKHVARAGQPGLLSSLPVQ